MANSVIGALRIMLGADTSEFEEGATSMIREAQRLERRISQMGDRLTGIGQGLTIGLTAPLAAFGTTAVQAAMESQDAAAQVQAALASMGNAAGRTMGQLQELAATQMGASLYDDDEILRSVTANLLTFGNISGEVFDRAQQAALDLSARLGTDLQGSAMLLGRALNDPVRGLNALTRSGVSFTAQQRDQIKAMVAAGDAAGAQALMLAELERQFGGAAAAAREANPLAAMQQSWANFQEEVGAKLLPLLPRIADAITGVLDVFGRLSPQMQTFAVGAGLVAAALGPVLMGIGALMSATAPFTAALGAIAGSGGLLAAVSAGFTGLVAALAPVAVPLAAVAAAGALIYANWDKIAPVLEELWATAQTTLGPAFRELVDTLSRTFTDLWQGPLGEMVRVAMSLLGELLAVGARVLGQGMILHLRALAEVATVVFGGIGNAIRTANGLFTGMVAASQALYEGVRTWLLDRLGAVFDAVREKIHQVERGFFNMYDAVVGHSWVPDMVDGIIDHFGRLGQGMVNPALDATATAEQAFADMATNVLGSLDRMASAIKGGGFFDILQAGIGLLGQFGVFGGGSGGSFTGGDAAWAKASAIPGFARGGAMRLGGLGGVDRNLLSLNGAPLARVSAGEVLRVSPANDAGGVMRVTVTMDASTGALGAFVTDQAGRVLAQAAPSLVQAGADAGVAKMNRLRDRAFA